MTENSNVEYLRRVAKEVQSKLQVAQEHKVLQSALACAERGWCVLRLRPGSKNLFPHDSTADATRDEKRIHRWFDNRPSLNLAVATGQRSNLVVIAIDSNGGEAALAVLEAKHGKLPSTLTSRTGDGGQQFFFTLPPGCGSVRSGDLANGVILKGDTDYAVIPPSQTTELYEWTGDIIDPVEAPAWLLTLIRQSTTRTPPRRAQTDADALVALVEDAELFCGLDDEAYATVSVNEHRETHRLRSKSFKSWLSARFYHLKQRAPRAQALSDALTTLEGRAHFAGPRQMVSVQCATFDEAIYLDLGNAQWEAVKVTRDGWCVVADPPVRFRRPSGMLPLPKPIPGGSVDVLWRFINVTDDATQKLVIGWLLDALRPWGPHPLLALTGVQGSAKTTGGRMLRALIDPNVAAIRSAPRETRDLMIAAANGLVVAFDNLSYLTPQLSDDLCRLATGGGFGTRQLYTDDDERLFDATRPVLLTAIEDVVTRPDLLDRAILIELPPISEKQRRPEAELWAAFERERPGLLGALLDAVVCALRRLPETTLDRLPRMADLVCWVTAAEPALGWRHGAFSEAYEGNQQEAVFSALDGSPVVGALQEFLGGPDISAIDESAPKDGIWTGTVGNLLTTLGGYVDTEVRRTAAWPKTPRGLSGALRRLIPALRAVGIRVTFSTRDATGRWVTVEKLPEGQVPADLVEP